MPEERYLAYYAERFDTVEINNSFYHLPEEGTLSQWRKTTSKDFGFSVKGSRYLTHMKKLKDPEEPLSRFLGRVETLKRKLGPVLFQLPPRWKANPQRLEEFLQVLPRRHRYAFEFRDRSWFSDAIYELLSRHHAAFCIYDLAGTTSPKEVTCDFAYVRLHGPGAAYEGSYSPQTLAGWAGAFSAWSQQGKPVYCYFDNDQAGYAPQNALRLKEMLDADAQ
jgi:uncharacterized protein YecE (DUF72 family)